MTDKFKDNSLSASGPAIGAFAITPSDSLDLAQAIRAVTIGGNGGVLKFVSSRDGQTYTTGALPQGTYPIFAIRLLATGTTATGMTGWV